MRIIVDGCDGCGKSTLVDKLVKEYNLDKVVMTREGWKAKESYIQKSQLDNVVSDRSFISEYVYANVYDRQTEINHQVFVNLFTQYISQKDPWYFILLTADVDTILDRVNKRGIDIEQRREVEDKVERYSYTGKRLQDIDNEHVLYLNTTDLSEIDVFNKVKEFLNERCNRSR